VLDEGGDDDGDEGGDEAEDKRECDVGWGRGNVVEH